MLSRYIEQTRSKEDFFTIKAISMDETRQRKGHNYITLIVDMKQRRTLYVTEGKNNSTSGQPIQGLHPSRKPSKQFKSI